VGEYVGEIISESLAEERGKIYDSNGCSFLFDMTDSSKNEFSIDSTTMGNYTKFFNHSCEPNLIAKK
jgi:[histone H3]-lysine9 N-trimethyltransferase SUV39H